MRDAPKSRRTWFAGLLVVICLCPLLVGQSEKSGALGGRVLGEGGFTATVDRDGNYGTGNSVIDLRLVP